ncbi:hypothetical protein HQQ86_14110 [Rathayibacter sp. VKM Ac-2857]|nr:hypothetical protein [Rathayibacter sp. VKM Ac-2857]
MTPVTPEYTAARRVLLDALGALNDHLDSLVLVGAQAVYVHTGDTDLAVPVMTTDADLAIDHSRLSATPEIGSSLRSAGFTPGANPGHWVSAGDIAIDLMVVPHQSGTQRQGARAARLTPHERRTARIARGLEPALVDNRVVSIAALSADDPRSSDLRVAGPAALLTAKAIKIAERLEQAMSQPNRLHEKDALDAFRLLQAIDVPTLVEGFRLHAAEPHAAAASGEAIEIYRTRGCDPEAVLPRLAAAAASGDPVIAPSFAALAAELVAAHDADSAGPRSRR